MARAVRHRIYQQFEKLGCSYDWDRVRFTLDESYVEAIMEEFRSLVRARPHLSRRARGELGREVPVRGLGYRGEYGDARGQALPPPLSVCRRLAAIITIATTRPETMLGDTAVAVNPADERYQACSARSLRLPLTDREIPLIADDYAKPEFGSGAVKVTPAHDLNDFECGQRHNLPQIVVIGKDGTMTEAAGADYAGLDRFEARKRVLADMEALGLLEKIEDYTIQLPHLRPLQEVIEPLLSEEWFVDMKPLAQPAIDAVKDGKIRFIPERYKRHLSLLDGEHPGLEHQSRSSGGGTASPSGGPRIRRDGRQASRRPAARLRADARAGWPRSAPRTAGRTRTCWTPGSPPRSGRTPRSAGRDETEDLSTSIPTNLLSTAQEILYLWVARMIMTGLDFMGEIPFRDVYIHATVLDEKGERMSKCKGNGVDPLDLIEQVRRGRHSLLPDAAAPARTRTSSSASSDVRSPRNFCNKLWNASRFVLMNLADDRRTAEYQMPESRPA